MNTNRAEAVALAEATAAAATEVTAVEVGADIGELLAIGLGVLVALIVTVLATWAFVKAWRDRGGP